MGDDPNLRGLSRKHIMHSIDDSLRRLGTDYVDLYQIHRFDHQTPIEETIAALDDVVRAGKARYLRRLRHVRLAVREDALHRRPHGTHAIRQHAELLQRGLPRGGARNAPAVRRAEGIAVVPFSPLARGFVTGNRRVEDLGETVRAKTDEFSRKQYYRPQDFAVVDAVTAVAQSRGVGNAQVAMAWVLQQPGVTAPIVGAPVSYNTLDDAAVAALALKLWIGEELKALAAPYQTREILGHS